MKSLISWAVLIAGLAFGLVFFNKQPMAFLIFSGITLSFVYFFALEAKRKNFRTDPGTFKIYTIGYSVTIFLVIYIISLFTIKAYQRPKTSKAYFSNVDHHALRNYGVAFNGDIDLFYDKNDSSRGLFPSSSGSLRLRIVNGGLFFNVSDFHTPLFQEKPHRLINPVFRQQLSIGTTLSDSLTSITFTEVESNNGSDRVDIRLRLLFTTIDTFFLADDSPILQDTISISGLKLERGLDLRTLISVHGVPGDPSKRDVVLRWLSQFNKIYLLRLSDNLGRPLGLTLFPGLDFFNRASILRRGILQIPAASLTVGADTNVNYYVGLENREKSFLIRRQSHREHYLDTEDNLILEFPKASYRTFSAIPGEQKLGATSIYFLKNTFSQVDIPEIREGLVFHDDGLKDNDNTQIESLLELYHLSGGNALKWSLHSTGNQNSHNIGENKFSLKSKNDRTLWLFEFTDFFSATYGYSQNILYLTIVFALITLVLVIFPGKNTSLIELPLFLLIYIFFVFRLILLWRITSFPPTSDISHIDLNVLLNGDAIHFRGVSFPTSLIWIMSGLGFLTAYRWQRRRISEELIPFLSSLLSRKVLGKLRILHFINLAHFLVLLFCFLILPRLDRDNFFYRILSIYLPTISYIFSVHHFISQDNKFHFKGLGSSNKFINGYSTLLEKLSGTPIIILNFSTLAFFAYFDTGFAVIFGIFCLLKNLVWSFAKPVVTVSGNRHKTNKTSLLTGLCFAIFLVVALTYKDTAAMIIKYQSVFIVAGLFCLFLFLISLRVQFLSKYWKGAYLAFCLVPAILLFVYIFVKAENVENWLDQRLRHVVYRTTILTTPLEEILLNNEHDSYQERKIIETAQSQWYINSYLNKSRTDFIPANLINFRPHFKTGVSYLTQTRDLVLPRYVISEFGGITMTLLMLFIATVFLIFFLSYKLSKEDKLHGPTFTGASVLCFLLCSALVIWLSSTNRFMFFGQDFPFLSLVSKTSFLFPVLLVVILLLQNLNPRFELSNQGTPNWIPMIFLFALISAPALFSGKSSQLTEENFTVNFNKVKSNMEELNSLFIEAQSQGRNVIPNGGNGFEDYVKEIFNKMYSDSRYKKLQNSLTPYELSLIENLADRPLNARRSGSPIFLRERDNILFLDFNQNFKYEPAIYEVKNVWRGDILQETISHTTEALALIRDSVTNRSEMIIVPAGYFRIGTGKLGLLNHQGNSNKAVQSLIYNHTSKQLQTANLLSLVSAIKPSDVVFLTHPGKNYSETWTVSKFTQPFFACSYTINGRNKLVYPMGENLYWVRPFSAMLGRYFRSVGQYDSSFVITLDYELNRNVSKFLLGNLSQYRKSIPEMSFSVITADGQGNMRLAADFSMQREIINPNDDAVIAKKEEEQFFIVKREEERQQWGNFNFLRLPLGPGSSIKPITTAAITSQLKLEWDNLQFVEKSDNPTQVETYAGYQFRPPWKMDSRNNRAVSGIPSFISQSHNMYHSTLIFLGSYAAEKFRSADGRHSLRNLLTTSSTIYPTLRLNGRNESYYLPPQGNWPITVSSQSGETKYFGNNNSLLAQGLNNNFHLLIDGKGKQGLRNSKFNFTSGIPPGFVSRDVWSFPEESFFLQSEREGGTISDNVRNGLRITTLGGWIYQITPYKMAELYGKLASTNREYEIRMTTGQFSRVEFGIDTSWSADFPRFLRENIIKGMEDVFVSGTASGYFPTSPLYRGYHLYGKTGTIDEAGSEDNSKRLAMIISNGPLTGEINAHTRFYVVYFSVNNAYKDQSGNRTWFQTFYRRIIDMIIESRSFQEYMRQ